MPKPLVAAPINLLTALNFNVPTPPGFPPVSNDQILASPEPLESLKEVEKFLNHLLLCGCGGQKDGCNWVIPINGVYYAMYWRDVAPRGPWTRQVWDVYRLQHSECPGKSPPVSLGHFWCWENVIDLILSDQQQRFRRPYAGAGGYTVMVGTNTFTAGSVLPQVRPRLWLDATDPDSLVLAGNNVEEWLDKSLGSQNATQPNPANQPELVPAVQNGLPVLRFDPIAESYLNLRLRNQRNFHLFVVGRFQTNPAWPQGIFLSAAGLEAPFSGIEGGVFQDSSLQPEGTLYTIVTPAPGVVVPVLMVPVADAGVFTIFEWAQDTSATGRVQIGNNAVIETVYQGDTSDDFWDSTRQTFGQPPPLPAAIGRQNQGINPMSSFNYLDGDIGEVLLYPEVLSTGQRISVLNNLRAKWALGSPLGLPDPPEC